MTRAYLPQPIPRAHSILAELWLDGAITLWHAADDPNACAGASRRTQLRRPLDELVRWERR